MGNKSKTRKKKTSVKNRTDLKSVLQSIYHDTADLKTTCCHQCECCNVACPSMNHSEYVQIATTLWQSKSHEDILNIICKSVEYFFRYEYTKWGMDALIKPCMFLGADKRCEIYEDRPLSCRIYGLWPDDVYNNRVDKFAKAYEKYGIKREELPLHKQCQMVKRVNPEVELTEEVINGLFKQLDDLDSKIGSFSDLQIRQKENYRTFHDWLLLNILGEQKLSDLTAVVLGHERSVMESTLVTFKEVFRESFANKLPEVK